MNLDRSLKLDPKEWGPPVWKTIDVFVKGYGEYPDANLRLAALNFFASLGELLPCPHCREHYKTLLKKRPVQHVLKNSAILQRWVTWMKGEVDRSIREKEMLKEVSKEVPETMSSEMPNEMMNKYTNVIPINMHNVPRSIDHSIHGGPMSAFEKSHPIQKSIIQKRNKFYPPPPPSIRKRNIGTPRNIPRATKSHITYNQQQASQIAANWKGSKAGLRKYIKANQMYNRPCLCGQ